jgi:hypothetical protein
MADFPSCKFCSFCQISVFYRMVPVQRGKSARGLAQSKTGREVGNARQTAKFWTAVASIARHRFLGAGSTGYQPVPPGNLPFVFGMTRAQL